MPHGAADGDGSRHRWGDNCVVEGKTLVTEAVWHPSISLGNVIRTRWALVTPHPENLHPRVLP